MVRVGVTGINATDNPGPGVAVARSLREGVCDLSVVGLSYDVHDPGNYMDFVVDESHRLPLPSRGWEPMTRRLEQIRDRVGLDAFIPSLDAELPLFIRNQDGLADLGIDSFLPSYAQFEARAKDRLPEFCRALEVRYPTTRSLDSAQHLERALEDFPLPAMIKGRYYRAFEVHGNDEAFQRYWQIINEWGGPILIQELVRGDEVNLVGIGDGLGGHCGVLSMKKMSTTSQGKVWTGVTIIHDELRELAERFVRQTRWRGPFELECIECTRLEEQRGLVMLEINPRFPSWVYLATGCGMNLPQRLLQLMSTGSCPRDSTYEAGRMFVRYAYELVTDLQHFQRLAMEGRSA